MRQFRRLPKAQDEMIAAWVLGGPEAIGRHSTRTVDSLMKKGYIDSDGPTKKALDYVEARHREVVGFNSVQLNPQRMSLKKRMVSKRLRRINKMSRTAARILVQQDYRAVGAEETKRQMMIAYGTDPWSFYTEAVKPIVTRLIDEGYTAIHIPRHAVKVYVDGED